MLTYRPRAAPHQPHLCLAWSCMSLKKHCVLYVCVKYMMQMWPMFITQTIYLSMYLSMYLSIYVSIYLSMYLSIYLYIYICNYMQHICMHVLQMGANPGRRLCRPVVLLSIRGGCDFHMATRGFFFFRDVLRLCRVGGSWSTWTWFPPLETEKKGQDPGKKSMEKEYWNYNNESGSLIDINPSYQNWHQGKQTNETRNKNNTRAVGQLQRHPPSFALAPAFFAAHLDVTPMRDGYWELAESLCWRPHLSTDRRPAIILDLCILGVQK